MGAELIKRLRARYERAAGTDPMLAQAADALEAAEAELTRRDAVIDSARALHRGAMMQDNDGNPPYEGCTECGEAWPCATRITLAAAPVSLEAVKAETVIDLDHVATGTVIRDSRGRVFQSLGGNWLCPGDSVAWPTLPAAVLWRPVPAEGVEK